MVKYLKHTPKIFTAVAFFVLLVGAFVLFQGRNGGAFAFEFFTDQMPDFYYHISNFSISYLLFSGIGYLWLMFGVPFRMIIGLGAVLLICNFVYELWIPFINTPDVMDAYFGLAGTALAFLFLAVTKEYGLMPADQNPEPPISGVRGN